MADVYGPFTNEQLVGRFAKGKRAQGADIVPYRGRSGGRTWREKVRALEVRFTATEFAEIAAIAPRGAAAGSRYAEAMMKMVGR